MPGIRLRVDASSAKVAVKVMKSSFSAISRGAKMVERSLARIGTGLKKGLASVTRHLFSLKSMLGGLAVGWVADKFMDVASSFEQMGMKLNALTKGHGVETLQEINDWAMKMPVNTQQAVDTFAMMKAMGLDPTIDSMQTLVDVSVLFGEDAMPRIARALGQMKTLGRLSAEELNQLSEVGINARKYLQEAFGTANAQQINKQGIAIEKVISTITAGLKKDFGGAAKQAMNTWQGVKTAFVSNLTEMAKMLADAGVFKAVKQGLKGISDNIGDWIQKQKDLKAAGIPTFFDKIGNKVKDVVRYIKGIVSGFRILADIYTTGTFDSPGLEKLSATASEAAISVLRLAKGLLSVRKAWEGVKFLFHTGEKGITGVFSGAMGIGRKIFPGKGLGDIFRKLQGVFGKTSAEEQKSVLGTYRDMSKILEEEQRIQKAIDALETNVSEANQKAKESAAKAGDEIKKVIRMINGKPTPVYININPAMKALDKLESRVNKMKLSLNVKMTGEASSRKPLTEKINDILDLYEKFPKTMTMNADMTSLSGALQAIKSASFLADINRTEARNIGENIRRADPWNTERRAVDRAMADQMRSLRSANEYMEIAEGIKQLIRSGYYSNGGTTSPETGGATTARLNIGPVNVTVSGSGGDRDLAITLADELDHEIAQKITHNRSEITAALGITNVSN